MLLCKCAVITRLMVGKVNTVVSVYVCVSECLSVCLSACLSQETHVQTSQHVAHGCGLVVRPCCGRHCVVIWWTYSYCSGEDSHRPPEEPCIS